MINIGDSFQDKVNEVTNIEVYQKINEVLITNINMKEDIIEDTVIQKELKVIEEDIKRILVIIKRIMFKILKKIIKINF